MNFPSWLRSLGGFSTSSQTEPQPDSQNPQHLHRIHQGDSSSKTSPRASTNTRNVTQSRTLKRNRSPSSFSSERTSKQTKSQPEEQNQSSQPWFKRLFHSVGINSIQTSQTNVSSSLERPLPDGWIKEIDRLGREFYVNQITHQTSFEFPEIEEIDVKPIIYNSMKKTQPTSKTSRMPLFLPDFDREESTQCDQESQIGSPPLDLSITSDSRKVFQRSHLAHSPPKMITSEGKKKNKEPVTLDLASDSSIEDIKPDLPIENRKPCRLKMPARQENPNNRSHIDPSDTTSTINEKTRSIPASTNQTSSHSNSESFSLDLEPYDEPEDQLASMDRDRIELSTQEQIQSHTPLRNQDISRYNSLSHIIDDKVDQEIYEIQEIQEIQVQQVNPEKGRRKLSTDEKTQPHTPSRTRTLSQSTSLSLDYDPELDHEPRHHQVDVNTDRVRSSVQSDRSSYPAHHEETHQLDTDRKEDRFLILTHLNEESSIEELIKFVKTAEDPKRKPKKIEPETETNLKLPEPLKIWCDLNSRGYPKSLWDLIPKSKRKFVGEKFNHGSVNHRFIIVEYEFRFQKELGYKFLKGGINGSDITFYFESVMVHLLDDINDLEGCDCIYDQNPEILTCRTVRENFKTLIKTLISIGEERKEKDLKPVWQRLTKEAIEDRYKKVMGDENFLVEDFEEYLNKASRVGIVRRSKVIVGKDLNQVDLLGLGESIIHWQLMKPFRKSIENVH